MPGAQGWCNVNEDRRMSWREKAQAARLDVKRSERRGGFLPKGHPYSILPSWVPYGLARLFMWVIVQDKPSKRRRRS